MPPSKGDQGQWALGHREPLNPNERAKRDDDGLNVRERILSRYAHTGFASIDPVDLRNRFRWWGLYTQRRPGIPGGQTATLEPEQLEDSFFMLRVRMDGGQLTSLQLRTVAEIAQTFGRDVADITDRQNVQLHWIRVEDVPEIWSRLESVGLSSTEACGDVPRVVLGCPLAGISADKIIDATPVLQETVARYVGNPAFSNLPRKFKTAMSGCADQCTLHEINDVSFVGVDHPELGAGYDLWVGGGLSTAPLLGQRLGGFVQAHLVADTWAGVTSLFRDYGYRRSRNRARLKFLVRDWGPRRFREVLEAEYLKEGLPDGPAPAPPKTDSRDHVGIGRQRDGRLSVGMALQAGRTSGTSLRGLADLAEEYGSGRVRTTTHQKAIVLDVADDRVENLVSELDRHGFSVRPSTFRRSTMACTGIEYCKLAIVETKSRANELVAELERRLPGFSETVGIHLNGCPNSCARFQVADIGLKGSIVGGGEGFQLHLGGHLGRQSRLARKLRGLKVTAEALPGYVEGLIRAFESQREEGETFADWVLRAEESVLQSGAITGGRDD